MAGFGAIHHQTMKMLMRATSLDITAIPAITYSIYVKAACRVSLRFTKIKRYENTSDRLSQVIHLYRNTQAQVESPLCQGPIRRTYIFHVLGPVKPTGICGTALSGP